MGTFKRSISANDHPSYGATTSNTSLSGGSSLRLDRVPEEVPDIDEEAEAEAMLNLEEQGYFIGSYQRFLALYTLVPLTSIITFVLLSITPIILFSSHSPRPHSKFFPTPIPELLTSAGLWSLSHLLRFPLFSLVSFFISSSNVTILVHTALHVVLCNLLRLSVLPILSIREDMEFPLPTHLDYAFKRIWWASLGWSMVEVAVAIWQGYEQIALYVEVMIPESRVKQMMLLLGDIDQELGIGGGTVEVEDHSAHPQNIARSVEEAVRSALDCELDRLVAIKAREELEDVYGIPVVSIPVFITCLQRIDSIILSLGLTLLTAASYLRSPLSLSPSSPLYTDPLFSSNSIFFIVFSLVVFGHIALATLYTPVVLPRIGVHTASYIGILVGLGTFFAGLGVWGALS